MFRTFTVGLVFLFMAVALEFAPAQCVIKPIKPIPPLGCKDVTPQCVTNSNGQSYWTWICVPDSGGADASGGRVRQVPTPERTIPRAPDQNAVQTAPVNPVVVASETPVTISDSSKPAVETLRTIAQQIEACPKALDFENRWGKKKDEIERFYQEAPANVIWNVAAGNSVRAPYLGYVEFTIAEDHSVPDSAGVRFWKSTAASIVQTGIMSASPWHYRYEYDLGPDGVKLTRVLLRNKTTGEWVEPNRSVTANHCWDSAARDTAVRVQENAAPPPQPAPLSARVAPSSPAQNSANVEFAPSAESMATLKEQAASGDAVAQYNLGVLYEGGKGVPQDDAQAAVWYRRAAEQGYAVAQYALGVFYLHGEGVPQDYAQETIWLRKAAEQGYANAQFYLGIAYGLGHGVPQNDAEAYFWVMLAVSSQKLEGVTQEDVSTAVNLVTSDLTPADLSRVQERVKKWLEDHPAKPQ